MNIEAVRISLHFLSRFFNRMIPLRYFLQTSGTIQIPTRMLTVMTAAIVTYWLADRPLTWPKTSPIALSALLAAIVS